MNRIFQSKINVFLSFSYIIAGLALMHQAIGATKRGHARDVAENASKLVVVPPSVHGLDAFSNRVRRGGICRHPSRRTWSLSEPQTADCVGLPEANFWADRENRAPCAGHRDNNVARSSVPTPV
jgi:hypothetical protein